MQTQTRITFQGLASSDALEVAVRDEAAALERYFDGITSCHVTLSEPHRHQHRGRLYRVTIHLAVPGTELVVGRRHGARVGHEDPYVAVREAFAAARRELEDYVRRLRGDVKRHDERPRRRGPQPAATQRV
jgi:ribosome-associated translation inhibitor RaiA